MEQWVVWLMMRVERASVVLSRVVTTSWFLHPVVGNVDHGEHLFNVIVLVHVVSGVFYVAAVIDHLLVKICLLCFIFKGVIVTRKRLSTKSNHKLLVVEWIVCISIWAHDLILKGFLAVPLVLSWRGYSFVELIHIRRLGISPTDNILLLIALNTGSCCCHGLYAISHLRVLGLLATRPSSLRLGSSRLLLLLLFLYLHLLDLLSHILLISLQLRAFNKSTKDYIRTNSKFEFRILLCVLLLFLNLFMLRHWRV